MTSLKNCSVAAKSLISGVKTLSFSNLNEHNFSNQLKNQSLTTTSIHFASNLKIQLVS